MTLPPGPCLLMSPHTAVEARFFLDPRSNHLALQGVSQACAASVAQVLQRHPKLQQISLARNHIGDQGSYSWLQQFYLVMRFSLPSYAIDVFWPGLRFSLVYAWLLGNRPPSSSYVEDPMALSVNSL